MDIQMTIITVVLLGCVTYLTGIKVLPTEVAATVYGSLATAIVVVIQKNTFKAAYQTFVKESLSPPPYSPPVINFSSDEPDTKKEGRGAEK